MSPILLGLLTLLFSLSNPALEPNADLRHSALAAKGTPKVAGLGSTVNPAKGRFAPRDLREQLAVEQAMGGPTAGTVVPLKMTDPRWPAADGWVKMQQIIKPGGNPINVHYLRNTKTGAIDDFKIVD